MAGPMVLAAKLEQALREWDAMSEALRVEQDKNAELRTALAAERARIAEAIEKERELVDDPQNYTANAMLDSLLRAVEQPTVELDKGPFCTCGCSVHRHYMTDGMDGCRDCPSCDWFTKAEGTPAPKGE